MSISKGRISFALVLIILGAWLLATNLSPEMQALSFGQSTWPYNVIGVGAFLGLIGLISWSPGWFIPAAIIAGIGGILFYQNQSGDWGSWAYIWTLIPGFVAVGLSLLALMSWKRGPFIAALWNLFASLLLFGIFGYGLGRLSWAGASAAAAFILLGLMFLLSPLLRSKNSG